MAVRTKGKTIEKREAILPPARERWGPDTIDINLDREVLLLAAPSFGGKSHSVVKLIEDSEEFGFKVVLVDRDRGVRKVWRELYGKTAPPDTVSYFKIAEWDRVYDAVEYALENLKQGDWFVVEQMGFLYDLCVTAYFQRAFGNNKALHTLALQAAAHAAILESGIDIHSGNEADKKEAFRTMQRYTGFGGLDPSAWSVIKEMYNDDAFVKVLVAGDFNVLYTTGLGLMNDRDKKDKRLEAFASSTNRPMGDRDLIAHMDTIAVGYRSKTGEHLWRTSLAGGRGKDRGGRELLRDISYHHVGFVGSYFDAHGLSLAPQEG